LQPIVRIPEGRNDTKTEKKLFKNLKTSSPKPTFVQLSPVCVNSNNDKYNNMKLTILKIKIGLTDTEKLLGYT